MDKNYSDYFVDYKKGYVAIEQTYTQENVGHMAVESMFYDHQQKHYRQRIRIWKHNGNLSDSYGDEIFDGTLEDLIRRMDLCNIVQMMEQS